MRKTALILIIFSAAMLLLLGCAAAPAANTVERDSDIVTVTFDFEKQSGYATNQFAVWIEDANGNFVNTLYATKFTANGGYEKRPDSIRVWVERSGLANMKDVDAITGATPKTGALRYTWDLTDATGARVPDGTYRFFVEGTLRWKNKVLFFGEIALDDSAASVEATADYTYAETDDQPALTAESPENAMIGNVRASYIPAY
ncbi:MAG: DUF2271 domain-containing protein [Eubacteriales bacterium]|jgi:hypothetical protein|nr:DUF2271 domain-containing protein [Eubacteriales bacterium]